MKTVTVPTFDDSSKYDFVETVKVEVNDTPTHQDMMKIYRLLPGLPCGFVSGERLAKVGKIDVRSFYDGR